MLFVLALAWQRWSYNRRTTPQERYLDSAFLLAEMERQANAWCRDDAQYELAS